MPHTAPRAGRVCVCACVCVCVRETHHDDFGGEAHVLLPGDTQHVGQVECEVDDPSTSSGQVGAGEYGADEETLHDGYHGEGTQEQEDHSWVTVGQEITRLTREGEKQRDDDFPKVNRKKE